MDEVELRSILEGILFVSDSPVKLKTLIDVLPDVSKESIEQTLQNMKAECEDPAKGLELVEVAGGSVSNQTLLSRNINRLKKVKPSSSARLRWRPWPLSLTVNPSSDPRLNGSWCRLRWTSGY